MTITKDQRFRLRQMLNLTCDDTAFCNFWIAKRDNALMVEMEDAGLVYWEECSGMTAGGCWRAYRRAALAVLEPGESVGLDHYYSGEPKAKEAGQ